MSEAHLVFDCFGGTVAVHVRGADGKDDDEVAREARATLLDAHARLSRFEPESELSRLNRDRREAVPASPLVRRLAAAVGTAGELSGGLVDATMLAEIEEAGYAASLSGGSAASPQAPMAPFPSHTPRKRQSAWRSISVDEEAGAVIRPPGVKIDGGGIAKGMLADVVAESLERCEVFAVDCCGDLRLGGRARRARRIRVEDPFGGEPLHELSLQSGALATSGTTRRAWLGPDGRRAHQILDPRSGRSAFTGIVQATAVAPSGLLAEVHAKAALLSGPEGAADWLPFGGVLVHDGGEVEIVAAEQAVPELAATTP